MRIIKLRSNGRLEIKGVKNELRDLQNEVGGYIEKVKFTDDLVLLMDEDAKMKRRKANPFTPGLYGDVVICAVRGEEFAGLSLMKARKIAKLFGNKEG